MSDPNATPSAPGLNPQLGSAALGAGNALLFGLPEAAIKAIGGDKVRQIVDAYKAKNPGYGAGETAGNVASMFIPGGVLLKGAGLGAKAIGAGKLASGLTKAGEVAGGSMGLKQGLAAAAEQAIPRAISEQIETGDAGKTASDLALNVAGGGAVGKTLGTVGKLAKKYIPPRPMEEVGESLNDQILSNVLGRDLTRGIRQVTKNSGGSSAQIEKIEDVKNIIVDQLEKNGIGNKQAAEDLLGENGRSWQKIGDNMNDAIASGTVKSLAELPDDLFTHPDMVDALKFHGPEAENAMVDLAQQIGRYADEPASVWVNTRKVLNDAMQKGWKTGSPQDIVKADVASSMKNYFDQKAMEVAPPDADIAKLKEIYPAFLAMGKALAREKATVAPAFTPGSDTFARFVTSVSPGGDLVTAVTGNIAGQALNKAATSGANIVGAELASKLRKALPRSPDGVPLEYADLPEGVRQGIGAGAKMTGTALERAAGPAVAEVMSPEGEQIQPETPLPEPQFPSIGGQAQSIPQVPVQQIGNPSHPLDSFLEKAWALEDPQGLIENSRPGMKQTFLDSVKKNLTNKDGTINYQRAGTLFFPDNPDDAKRYTESYTVLQKINQGLPNAVRLLTVNNPKAEADRQSVIGTVSDILRKNQGMKDEQAENVVKGILNNPLKTAAEKQGIIMNLLRTADPMSFGKGGVLERAGIMK